MSGHGDKENDKPKVFVNSKYYIYIVKFIL